jgi:hypothetical protein
MNQIIIYIKGLNIKFIKNLNEIIKYETQAPEGKGTQAPEGKGSACAREVSVRGKCLCEGSACAREVPVRGKCLCENAGKFLQL